MLVAVALGTRACGLADGVFAAFGLVFAPETVFFVYAKVLSGRYAFLSAWKVFFVGPQATFSCEPDEL